ncbi:uncharacterized protein TNCT_594471 [Trichonephila clavata]|uniref:Uncharacterized protein n=1 Tax=Trichonephila clavata TaxID=2740835 RepID=A0A8X6LL79_TRICU|nr:uncharacterized protein TNCT_594471 [Trichonephila clavata]
MNVIPLPPKNANKKNVTKKTTTVSTTKEPRDEFPDLFKYSTLSPNFRQYMEWPPYFRLPKYNPTLADVLKVKIRRFNNGLEEIKELSTYKSKGI